MDFLSTIGIDERFLCDTWHTRGSIKWGLISSLCAYISALVIGLSAGIAALCIVICVIVVLVSCCCCYKNRRRFEVLLLLWAPEVWQPTLFYRGFSFIFHITFSRCRLTTVLENFAYYSTKTRTETFYWHCACAVCLLKGVVRENIAFWHFSVPF